MLAGIPVIVIRIVIIIIIIVPVRQFVFFDTQKQFWLNAVSMVD